jgi:predicted TIM-barrel fold metal-dependent hydrolase
MPVIDADTHVDETEATWAGMKDADARFAPVTMGPPLDEVERTHLNPARSRFWLVEGRLQVRAVRDDIHHPLRPRRELEDLEGRLQDMDRMGVDIQVLFPTFFIRYVALNSEPEAALARSYNRWIAEKCTQTKGRLRWVAVLPWLNATDAIDEMRWAKANGACGIFKRGFDLDKSISDPHFFPIYQEANDLDLPLCVHTGHPGSEWDRGFPIMASFLSVVTGKLAERFPKLRFGFIEAGASWIPYAISQLAMVERTERHHERDQTLQLSQDVLERNRIFVTIDPVDDIQYLLTLGAGNSLMIGTDYSHTDQSANLSALSEVTNWADQGKITKSSASKILETNPERFYGF